MTLCQLNHSVNICCWRTRPGRRCCRRSASIAPDKADLVWRTVDSARNRSTRAGNGDVLDSSLLMCSRAWSELLCELPRPGASGDRGSMVRFGSAAGISPVPRRPAWPECWRGTGRLALRSVIYLSFDVCCDERDAVAGVGLSRRSAIHRGVTRSRFCQARSTREIDRCVRIILLVGNHLSQVVVVATVLVGIGRPPALCD